MKETWKQFMEKKGIKKWFQRDNLIILILSGVLLLIIALPTKDTQKDSSPKQNVAETGKTAENTSSKQSGTSTVSSDAASDAYAAELEQRLSKILSGMSGVGKVNVMITLQSSEELVVEKDQPISRSNTTETDSEGGSRNVYQTDSDETTVYRSAGSDSDPFVVKTLTPKVEGVVIVAEGAGSGDTSKNITEAVQALFGIEAHKIKVLKMRNTGN